jgi:ankyrin repeat protein
MGSSDTAAYLINEAQVNVNQACDDNTPLMWAAKMGRSNIVTILLNAGADASIQVNGKTALDLARENGNEIAIELLN